MNIYIYPKKLKFVMNILNAIYPNYKNENKIKLEIKIEGDIQLTK